LEVGKTDLTPCNFIEKSAICFLVFLYTPPTVAKPLLSQNAGELSLFGLWTFGIPAAEADNLFGPLNNFFFEKVYLLNLLRKLQQCV
jgi:hypothetical protein